MSILTAPDGARIFYKDWGRGQPILFSHGWPLSADVWDNQLLFFGQSGFRVIAHDRRGHGRSDQTWHGNDINQYADDLALLIETLDLRDLILVGHAIGGGEVARYIGRHGSDRVAKVVLVGAVPPLMLQTPVNPEGTPMAAFDGIRSGVAGNRSQFFKDLAVPFYGLHCDEVESNAGLIDHFWLMGMQGGMKGQYDGVSAFSEVDFTADLLAIDRPTLLVHGDADRIVPIGASALKAAKLMQQAELNVYADGAHGLAQVDPDRFNADLLAFIQNSP
ncbi:alpha/beta fold hydrolase, partial [Serratia marcescens]|uniref:alpha/beta fold hydrolase n=1 Tax=Serratia marcescens TaxID=615 RepID=UPI002813EFF6